MLAEDRAYDLVKKSGAMLKGEKLVGTKCASAEILEEIRSNKWDIMEYMSGHCFNFQVAYMDAPVEWVVLKTSTVGDVIYPAEEIFSGTAYEVDTWCKQHKDDPFFSDKYDITKHPHYRLLSDANPKNWYQVDKEINPQYLPKPDEVVDIAIDLKSSNITFSTSAAAITDYTHSTILTSFTEIRHINSIRCYRISPVIRQTPLYRFSPIT